MIEPLFLILTAITMFIATNIDDLFILMLFFASTQFDNKQVIMGQYIGVMALILISALSYFLKFLIPIQWIGLLGIVPIIIGLKNLKELRRENNNFQEFSEQNNGIFSKLKSNKTLLVSSVTIANGGDNIGVYIPLFASIDIDQAFFIILVFMVMVGIWCFISFKLVDNRIMGDKIRKYGHIILPFVLIGLGIAILLRNFIM